MKIYLLKVECYFDEEEHYENVYSTKDKAIKEGKERLEKIFKKQYKSYFDDDDEKNEIPELTYEQLFKLKAIYDFSIIEYDPQIVDELDRLEKLPIIEEYYKDDLYSAEIEPLKIIHSYDYNGNEIYISGQYAFNYKGQRIERKIMMNYEDYNNPLAGSKFKIGDIVKIKKCNKNYDFEDKLHVITEIPHKKENQKFFRNSYKVIVNHNSYDEGCHVDVFDENELELYTEKLPEDSPLIFLSKYFKGEIKLENTKWIDIECGNITLNENKSFRDIEEIRKQMEIGEKNENRF